MRQTISRFLKNFLKCGLTGWCIEIIFTAANALRRRDMTLKGNTSLWMFPIYGCAVIFAPIGRILRQKPTWLRGLTYTIMIFSAEFFTGKFLKRRSLCPWDYGQSRWNISRVIRLDFAPYWFIAGLLFERLLVSPPTKPDICSTESQRH